MKILQENEKYVELIGIYALRAGETSKFNRRNIAVLLIIGAFLMPAAIFFLFGANTIQEYTESFFMWMTMTITLIGFVSAILKSMDLFIFKDNLERIIENQLIDPVSKCMYENINVKINKWTRILHTLLIKISVPFGIIPLAMLSYYLYYTTELGSDAFYLPLSTALPFNWKTPFGYAATLLVLGILFGVLCHTFICAIGSFIGFFGIMMSFGHSIRIKFRAINDNYTIGRNDERMRDELCTAISFHLEAKKSVSEFTNIFENNISLYYLWSLLAICDSLLMCQAAQNWIDLFQPFILIFWSFAQLFLICELGERLIHRFNEINKEVFFWDWYMFPMSLQKFLPIILIGTRNQVGISGFGNIICTHESFKNVSTKGFSYFTVIHNN